MLNELKKTRYFKPLLKFETVKTLLKSRVENLMFLFQSKMKIIFPLKIFKNKAHAVKLI